MDQALTCAPPSEPDAGVRPEEYDAPVPLLDTTRTLAAIAPELTDAFLRVLRSGQYILGPEVSNFEAAVAAYTGAKHGIGVSSGTDALLVALMGLKIGPGDEVVVPSYTFFASAGTIWRLGAKPVFVDSCPGCFNALPTAVSTALTGRARAIMPVHLFGQMADMETITSLATQAEISVVQDAAQSLGARLPATDLGANGSMSCYSFFPSKNLGAFGDAGMVTVDDDGLADKLRVLRMHGAKPKYHHALVGGNFRLDALQAALLQVKLPHLDAACAQRQANAALYTRLFEQAGVAVRGQCICQKGSAYEDSDAAIVLPVQARGRHVFNQYVIRINRNDASRRDAVRRRLAEHNIGAEVYYPIPLHLQACFASLGYRAGAMPHAERAARETLALPIFPGLTEAEIGRVVDTVIAAVKS